MPVRMETPPALLPACVLLCLAGGFLLPGSAAWGTFTYLTLLPAMGWRLWRGGWAMPRDPVFLALLALWGWSSLTIAWDHILPGFRDGQLYWLRNALCTLAWLCGFGMAQAREPRLRGWCETVMILGGAVNAALAVGLHLAQGGFGERLTGYGVTQNPVLGTAILDICLLLALGRAVRRPQGAWGMALAALPMLAYLAFGFSRAPLLALAAAAAVLGGGLPVASWGAALAVGGGAGLLAWRFLPGLWGAVWAQLMARGTDCHLEIWQAAWRQFLEHPLLGNGPSARLPITSGEYCPLYPGPHNLYLALLDYSGLIGFTLFGLCLVLLGWRLCARAAGFERRLYLAIGLVPLVAGLSDLSQVIKGPAPIWYILWLPALLIMSLPRREGVKVRS